jgi:RimJ/RimL family protein N-acetyltransferase
MINLLPINADGTVAVDDALQPGAATDILEQTAALYARVGFNPPWISYLAVEGTHAVGVCSFKSAPVEGRVEIAYFTFPGNEGRGIATAMAARLVAIARDRPGVACIAAQTLPGRNASHRILEKLGFHAVGTVEHPGDGTVLEWQLVRART